MFFLDGGIFLMVTGCKFWVRESFFSKKFCLLCCDQFTWVIFYEGF